MSKILKFSIIKNSFQIVIVLLIGFALIASPQKVYGQTLSLSLWPPLFEAMIQPGRTVSQAYQLTNNSDHALVITPQIFVFEPVGENGQVRITALPPSANRNPSPSFSFSSGEFFGQPFALAVGQTRNLVLKTVVPADNPEKDYYYTLLFSTAEEPLPAQRKEDHGQTATVTQIGSNILLTVSQLGKPVLLGRITGFSAPIIIDSFSAVNFEVVLENWGNTLWKPFGQISVSGLLGQKGQVRLWEQNVLANSSRRLQIEPYRPRLPIGPFKAELNFTLNEDGQKLFTEVTFWYLPLKAGLALLVLILVFLITKKIKNKAKSSLDKKLLSDI